MEIELEPIIGRLMEEINQISLFSSIVLVSLRMRSYSKWYKSFPIERISTGISRSEHLPWGFIIFGIFSLLAQMKWVACKSANVANRYRRCEKHKPCRETICVWKIKFKNYGLWCRSLDMVMWSFDFMLCWTLHSINCTVLQCM